MAPLISRAVPTAVRHSTDVRFGSKTDMKPRPYRCPVCPPKRALQTRPRHVRFVPEADISRWLFDHLVSAGEQCGRYGEAKCPGSLEIDHQLVLRRCLHRQVCRLLAFKDAVHVAGRATIL